LVHPKVIWLKNGITQSCLARALGGSDVSLSSVIRGEECWQARFRRLIAEKLDVPRVQIFPSPRIRKRAPGPKPTLPAGESA
jgi:lambda repressor-like predicted transcriptional regulator